MYQLLDNNNKPLQLSYGNGENTTIFVSFQKKVVEIQQEVAQLLKKQNGSFYLQLRDKELDEEKTLHDQQVREGETVYVIDMLGIKLLFQELNKQYQISIPKNKRLYELEQELYQMKQSSNQVIEFYKGTQKLDLIKTFDEQKIVHGDTLLAKIVKQQVQVQEQVRQNVQQIVQKKSVDIQYEIFANNNQILIIDEDQQVEQFLENVATKHGCNSNQLKLFYQEKEIGRQTQIKNLISQKGLVVLEFISILLLLPQKNKQYTPQVCTTQKLSEVVKKYQNYFTDEFQIVIQQGGVTLNQNKTFKELKIKEMTELKLLQKVDGG